MINLSNVSFTYPGTNIKVLNDVSLEIKKGEFVALIGNNGCGKSTLCKVMNGLIPQFIQGDLIGNVEIEGESIGEMRITDIAQRIGYVYQDFENQIVKPKVIDEVGFAPMNYGMEDYEERAYLALKEVGIDNLSEHYIWQLSGGQKHLVALAGVLALGPDVLILDEPIAQLDPKHASLVYDCLKRLNQKGKTIIVIEHHAEYIAKYCHEVILMKEGQIQFKLPMRQALSEVETLLENNIFPPVVTQLVHALSYDCKSLPMNVEEAIVWLERMQFRPNKASKAIEICKNKERSVELRDIQLGFKGIKNEEVKVFKRLSLSMYNGEKIAVIGNNGAGKTTLLKMMTGLVKPQYGTLYIKGENILNLEPETIAQMVAYVYQNSEEMFIKDSIEKDIAFGMQERKVEYCDHRTASLLKDYRLEPIKMRDGRLLSGGQMRRASLAIGVALYPAVLLLDEPTANLDIGTRKEIHQTLKRLKGKTETVIIATHDMQLVSEWADRVLVLNQGEVIADGRVDEIFGDDLLLQKAGIEKPPLFELSQQLQFEKPLYTVQAFVEYLSKEEMAI